MSDLSSAPPGGEVILFLAPDGRVRVEVRLEGETVWLTQVQMAELFGRERSVISKHVGNVFKVGELDEGSNVHFLHIAGSDNPVGYYSLDVIAESDPRQKDLMIRLVMNLLEDEAG